MRTKDSITVTDTAEREGKMAQARTANEAYSMAGAARTAADAAVVGKASLAMFDQAEMEKLYPTQESREQFLAAAQSRLEEEAEARVQRLKADEQRRASIVGGLAYTSVLDVDATTDLSMLPEDALEDLPWNLPILGPHKYGTVHVRKDWTEDEAMEQACMLDWNVRVVDARWSTKRQPGKSGSSRVSRFGRLIVRDPVERYAARCHCENYHGRPGEPSFTEVEVIKRGKTTIQEVPKDPCPWTVEWDLGQCRGDWRAEIQNEDLVGVLQAFTEDGRFTPQSCLWLDGGARVAIQMKLSETRFVLGDDPHGLYLTVMNPFTGHGKTKLYATAVRNRCANTQWFGESSALFMAGAAHVGNIKGALVEVGRAGLRAAGFFDDYAKQAEQLAALELSLTEMKDVADKLIEPTGKTEQAQRQTERRRADLLALMVADETIPSELRRTGYGVVQSANRFLANPDDTRTQTSRLTSVWAPDGKARKGTAKAQELVQTIGRKRTQVAV